MKPKISLIIVFGLVYFTSCDLFVNEQNRIPDCEFDYEKIDRNPILIGGLAELQSSVEYPSEAIQKGVEGRILLSFIVNKKGKPIEIRQVEGIGYNTFEAAKEALLKAEFIPGLLNEEPVCVYYTLPIVFRLPN